MRVNIEPALAAHHEEVLEVWEASVRSSHDFLTEEDIRFYRGQIAEHYLGAVDLHIVRQEGRIVAFAGFSGDTIEMLFVHPDAQGCGLGTALIELATIGKGLRRVDVNEQNTKAVEFYRARGFVVIGRDATDPDGRPFPILHMEKGHGK